ncbi:MAG: adenosine kinase [Victivallales bacterium]|nr:adenosine kinase [Victivallales bacterium]
MPDPKVLGVGSPMLDLLVNVDDELISRIGGEKGGMELVSPEKLEHILDMTGKVPELSPGGSSANTIFGLAHLGLPTALLGKTGKDEQAEFYMARYAAMGGDTSRLKVNPSMPTGRCLSLITPDSERTMRTDLGAAATLAPQDISINDFNGISHVHVEGYLIFNRGLLLHVLSLAKQAKCTVSLDLASFEIVKSSMDILPDIIARYVDIVFANEEEAVEFSRSDKPEDAVAEFAKIADTVAVKLGKQGAVVRHCGETARIPARVVEAVDTTGAGDLWASGFLFGLLKGKSIFEAGTLGALVSSEVVQVLGAAIPENIWRKILQPL